MTWTQLKNPNTNITYVGGWCLKAVQDAFNTDHPYPTAIAQWNGIGEKYGGEPPLGIAVPIFFTMSGEPAGHVAIRLIDGRVASSSQSGTHKGLYIHRDIADIIDFYKRVYKLTYIGWKTVVGTQEVVKQGVKVMTPQLVNLMYAMSVFNRQANPDDIAYWQGKDPELLAQHLYNNSRDPMTDLLNWKSMGIDALPYKNGVVNSKAWTSDMATDTKKITNVLNDLWQFKQDHNNDRPGNYEKITTPVYRKKGE